MKNARTAGLLAAVAWACVMIGVALVLTVQNCSASKPVSFEIKKTQYVCRSSGKAFVARVRFFQECVGSAAMQQCSNCGNVVTLCMEATREFFCKKEKP